MISDTDIICMKTCTYNELNHVVVFFWSNYRSNTNTLVIMINRVFSKRSYLIINIKVLKYYRDDDYKPKDHNFDESDESYSEEEEVYDSDDVSVDSDGLLSLKEQ